MGYYEGDKEIQTKIDMTNLSPPKPCRRYFCGRRLEPNPRGLSNAAELRITLSQGIGYDLVKAPLWIMKYG